MTLSYFLNFDNEFTFFLNNLKTNQNYFSLTNYSFFLFYLYYTDYNYLVTLENLNIYSKSIINFINQTENLELFNNLENIKTIYHYSIPNLRLSYPEPFIASASFMHNDIWFIHILVYQYWLWFVFVFLIIFFFINFISTLRWCNLRIKPKKETRGVSRSKCADLITACVPVSWATSIIVSESTDAIDYYDGFGTTELVVGIRAYQWGWEYYYPKDIDLNYNIKNNYSTFIGNSLKYYKTTDINLKSNNLWKFYQNKNFDSIITPAHLIILPIDNNKLLNFLNFNDLGSNPLNEPVAFKKTRMTSKTYFNNLINPINNFNYKWKYFSNLIINDNLFNDSLYYGIKRQHNFLNNLSILNNQNTFFNLNSVQKWLDYTINYNFMCNKLFKGNLFFNFFKKNLLNSTNILYFNIFQNKNNQKQINYNFFKNFNLTFKNSNNLETFFFFTLINKNTNDTVFNENELNFNLLSLNYSNKFNFKEMFLNDFKNNKTNNFLLIQNFNNFNFTNFSNFINFNNFKYYNYYNLNNSILINKNLINLNNYKINNLSTLFNYDYNNIEFDKTIKNHVFNSTNPISNYKKSTKIINQNINNFFNYNLNNNLLEIRLEKNFNYNFIRENFYLPFFNLYYDYDFRNWQTLELLEDTYWESVFSIYLVDEYTNLSKNFYNNEYSNKYFNFYNNNDKKLKLKNQILLKSFNKFKLLNNTTYPNSIILDDSISNINLNILNNSFQIINFQSNLEDSFESSKFLNYIYNFNNKNIFKTTNNLINPITYSLVFDMFRSDYDDFSWYFDDLNLNKNSTLGDKLNYFDINSAMLNYYIDNNLNNFDLLHDLNYSNNKRFSNYLNLRSSVKNSMVTYNAIQKVFKSRFDEGRSNVKLTEFGNFYSKQPYVSSTRISYEKLLGKNKTNFFKTNFFKTNFFNNLNNLYLNFSSLNFYNFDFPFLLAAKSDASRYLWFDWFAKWGFYEVQPSSSSKYAIFGMPYFSKNFEFGSQLNENLNETETYFTRLSRARKSYLPNWIYTPYFYAKHSNWFKKNIFFEIFEYKFNNIISTFLILKYMNWYWNNLNFFNYNSYLFFPSNSNLISYSRGSWKPQSSIQSYYFSTSKLIDILTKREYLYRQLFESNNKIIHLPFYLTNSPKNPLIKELKSTFLFIDPNIYNSEYSRDIYFNSLTFFNLNLLKSILNSSNNLINLSFLNNYLLFYLFNINSINNNNYELYKNQYRPLKKGISNMIRLHATGAIAMPVEIRLQILASSKDVIHSWAIPSAGIKIDCVPGYSSHKVAIFLLSGIFWGQCMEICGRYHHWMPIVVYFMKRDLFFLWCTHFVFLSNLNNNWNINDRQFIDYTKNVSYNKLSWLDEILN